MALKQHSSIDERFRQQYENARDYVLPFIESIQKIKPKMKVLEIGAAEGGVLRPFTERGCWVLGVDLAESRIATARQMMAEEVSLGKADFQAIDVYEESFQRKWDGVFDLIILKDTIEHIPNQEAFIPYIKRFLAPDGKIFFGFPPWRMPFGGHQQICKSKFLGMLPWYHILPRPIYKGIITLGREPQRVVDELMDIKSTRISIGRFEDIIKASGLTIFNRQLYLFNPIYRFKFGLQPRKQSKFVGNIPWFRDFVTTCGWYMVGR